MQTNKAARKETIGYFIENIIFDNLTRCLQSHIQLPLAGLITDAGAGALSVLASLLLTEGKSTLRRMLYSLLGPSSLTANCTESEHID